MIFIDLTYKHMPSLDLELINEFDADNVLLIACLSPNVFDEL